MTNKNLLCMSGDIIRAKDIVFWTDWDGVATASTVRESLTESQNTILGTIASHTAFAAIITNSDPREVEKTIHPEVIKSGLSFVGEHGSCAKLAGDSEFKTHPDLTVDRTILDDVHVRAIELIKQFEKVFITDNGRDLQRGELFLKPERKFTSFCIVRTMNGFDDRTKSMDIEFLNWVTSKVMSQLDKEFNMTSKRGWTKTVGADAQEFAQAGFDKIGGIRWIELLKGLEEKTHFMFEDSNPALLQWLGKNRNAFNFAVGNGLDNCDYIFGKLPDIQATWALWENIASDLEEFNGVHISTLRAHTRRLVA